MSDQSDDDSRLRWFARELIVQAVLILVTVIAPVPVRLVVDINPQVLQLLVGTVLEALYVTIAVPHIQLRYSIPGPQSGNAKIVLVADVPSLTYKDVWIRIEVKSRSVLGHSLLRRIANKELDDMCFCLSWSPHDFVRLTPLGQRAAGMAPSPSELRFNPVGLVAYGERSDSFSYPLRVALGRPGPKTSGELVPRLRGRGFWNRLSIFLCRKNLEHCQVEVIYRT